MHGFAGQLGSAAGTGGTAGEPDFVGEVLAPVMLLAGVLMLGFFFVRAIRAKYAKREAATPTARERMEAARSGVARPAAGGSPIRLMGPTSGGRASSRLAGRETVHVEESRLLDTSQRLASQLDAKAERLEQLLARAEVLAARLESAARVPSSSSSSSLSSSATAEGEARSSNQAEAPAAGRAETENGAAASSGGRANRDAANDRSGARIQRETRGARLDPLTAEVYRRADAGEDAVTIAQAMEEQIGKVELILALRQPGAGA